MALRTMTVFFDECKVEFGAKMAIGPPIIYSSIKSVRLNGLFRIIDIK